MTAASTDAIEQAITRLVQEAPAMDAGVVDGLGEELRGVGSPLALSIARVVELVGEGLIDPGIALPPLAMACATLAGGVRGTLGPRELEAARFEIETLLPMPDGPRPKSPLSDIPDVPLTSLRKR